MRDGEMKKLFIIITPMLLVTNMCTLTQKAVVTVPVADLVGQPMQTIHPDRTAYTKKLSKIP